MKRATLDFIKLSIMTLVIGLSASSCYDHPPHTIPGSGTTDTTVIVTNTITDIVVADDNFSILEAAVLKAGLEGTLSGTGPYTVFAPDDNAFIASGFTLNDINMMSAADVNDLLLYHTLASEILAADVPAGPNAKVVTANGDSVFVTNNAAGVFVNGVKVATADIAADNGVIHVIEKVLQPATGNLVQTAVSSGLDSLVKAVARVNNEAGGNPNFITTLNNTTLTVFAPTNAAFSQLLTDLSLTDIDAIPLSTLTAVLQYHVVSGRAFSSDLSNGALAMLSGSTTIDLTGTPTITGTGNMMTASNIIATDILTTNGAVHLIDRVLLP